MPDPENANQMLNTTGYEVYVKLVDLEVIIETTPEEEAALEEGLED